MTVFLVVLQSALNALGTVVTQKVLAKRAVGNDWQTFIARGSNLVILTAFLSFSAFEFPRAAFETGAAATAGLFLLSTAMVYSTYPLRRTAYMNEKISVLQPFVMARQAFVVIASFFLLSESVSVITFGSALLAIFVVTFAGTNGLKLAFNRYCAMVFGASLIQALQILIVVRFVSLWGAAGFYYVESIAIVIISAFLIVFRGKFSEWKNMTPDYLKLQIFSNVVALAAVVLTLFFYGTLGIVVTSLVSFLYLAFLYAMNYALSREIPSKGDVLSTLAVLILIAV
jgi:hypothetical protein